MSAAVGRLASSHFLGLFAEDVARWIVPEQMAPVSDVSPSRTFRLLWRHPPLRATAWFRFGSWAKVTGLRGVPGAVQRRILRHYGLEISPGADIGGGLYIAHPVGCTLSVEKLGANATIIGSVTMGTRGDSGWPIIGDRVFIGAGARVLGRISVGDGAIIGANAVVISDVAAHATVVGVPARATRRSLERLREGEAASEASGP